MDPVPPAPLAAGSLPTGTVTLLFTDVEGSTRLWEQHPAAMRRALVRHDALIEDLVQQYGGTVVRPRGEGDSRFAVFPRATAAVAAAAALQQALAVEPWPVETPLRVRVALHSGEADLREGDYYGSAVNRCARLRAIAHGGQTLLSQATHDLVRDALPAGVLVRELGQHRLADLQRAEQVYQLLAEGVCADFPPLRSLEASPNNLPLQLTSFVGREREMAEVKGLLEQTRLLTLTGTGGVGKTRLALQVVADLLPHYPQGVWLVELAPLADPAQVPRAVAAALGAQEDAGRPLVATLTAVLRPRHVLLLLDNCEHLIDPCVLLIDALLRSCPHVRILATSREALGLGGETAWRVPSLALPGPQQQPSAEALAHYEAVRLFVDHARAAQPHFAMTARNATAVAQLCRRLDGIPLAIELAAARVRGLSVEQLTARLDQRFRLLTGGSRAALPRQQTLQAMVDWSFSLLSPPEQALFARLSVFAGGFTLEAVEAVCAGEEVAVADVLDLLMRLVDKSLVVVEDGEEGSTRYTLLETLRQYGREKLVGRGDAETAHGRHAAHFLAFASANQHWLNRLEMEHDNLRAALTWCLDTPAPACQDAADAQASAAEMSAGDERAGLGVQLAGQLGWFWYFRGHRREGLYWLERALARSAAVSPLARAVVLLGAGFMVSDDRDAARGLSWLADAVALYEALGDRQRLAFALGSQGCWTRIHAGYEEGTALLDRALSLARDLADPHLIGSVLQLAVLSADLRRDDERLRTRLAAEESIRLYRQTGDALSAAITHWPLGLTSLYDRDFAAARQAFAAYRDGARTAGDRGGVAVALTLLGDVAWVAGDLPAAAPFYQESLALWRDMGGFSASLAHVLCGLGEVALAARDLAAACAYMVEGLSAAREAAALGGRVCAW